MTFASKDAMQEARDKYQGTCVVEKLSVTVNAKKRRAGKFMTSHAQNSCWPSKKCQRFDWCIIEKNLVGVCNVRDLQLYPHV